MQVAPKKSLRFLFAVFLSNLFLSSHYFLITYINSSFLEQFFSPTALSFLFILGSAISLVLILKGPALIKRFSNYRLTLFLIFLEFIAILGLAFTENPLLIALLFIIHQAMVLMLFYNLDIFLEEYSPVDESRTGGIRGVFLTFSNLTLVIAPAVAGLILGNGFYWKVYLFSALFLIPLYVVVKRGLREKADEIASTSVALALKRLRGSRNLRNVLTVKFVLQLFFVWMVIYIPIHLHQNLGFDWPTIGLIFTIMLLPYLIFTAPLGKLSDTRVGEKEIMTAGLIIIALSTALIPFIKEASFLLWAGVLFMTRVGASFTDISTDSYFFKQVNSFDAEIISLYRVTSPISLIIAPIVAIVSIQLVNYWGLAYQFIFLVPAIITLLGIKYSLTLTDTG
jgi:MFS family permease